MVQVREIMFVGVTRELEGNGPRGGFIICICLDKSGKALKAIQEELSGNG